MPSFRHHGVEFCYSDGGRAGSPHSVVFLHGLLVSSEVWAPQMERLAPIHRVLAIDWPGHGVSPPNSPITSIDDLVDAVASFMDELGVRRGAFVGLSLGGIVALALSSRFPDRVESLALLSTPRAPETEIQRARHLETLKAASRIGQTAVLRGIAHRLFGATTRRTRPELVSAWLERATRLDLDSVRSLSEAALGRPEAPLLAEGAPRTLVVHGDEDALVSRADSEALAESLGNATFVTIPESGHLIPLERPDALAEALAVFFGTGKGAQQSL